MARLKCQRCKTVFDGRSHAKYCGAPCRAAAAKERREKRRQAQPGGHGRSSRALTSAFTRSIKKAARTPADGAAVALARRYAREIDSAEPDQLLKLAPQMLAILDHLRMAPRSREARKDAVAADNATRLEVTIESLTELGHLEDVDSARVQMLRSIARAVDADPGNAALWRQYREALGELISDDSGGSLDEEIDGLFSEASDTSET